MTEHTGIPNAGHLPAAAPMAQACPARPVPIWPVVIGVLAIVLGAKSLTAGWQGPEVQVVYEWLAGGSSTYGTGEAVGVLLLLAVRAWQRLTDIAFIVGGALLLRRRRAGARLLFVCAIAQIIGLVAAPVAVAFGYGSPYPASLLKYFVRIAVISVVVGLAWPICLLVWLLRRRVRRHVAGWRDPLRRRQRPPPGSAWPTTLGALAIIITGSTCAIWICRVAMELIARILWDEGRWDFGWLLAWFLARSVVLAAGAITGGFLLMARCRAGVVVLIVYAMLAILIVVATPVIIPLAAGMSIDDLGPSWLLWQIPFTLIGLVWPVFLLVWLLLPKSRVQARSWAAERLGWRPPGALSEK